MQEDELEQIVHVLFADNSNLRHSRRFTLSARAHGAQRLTMNELKRERDLLVSIVDSAGSNMVTYEEVDSLLFQLAHRIDDNNLTPKIGHTGVEYLDKLEHSTSFLSAPTMRKLIYFDDLREYSAMHEVYRITGCAKLEHESVFPTPSLWHQGEGVELFWDSYTIETGCSRTSLHGQDIHDVQRKLVRILW